MERIKIHHVYKLANGERVPSVTTVLNILAKPALLHWSWECGIRGEDYRKVRDAAAGVGTLVHLMIMAHLKKTILDTSEYSQQDIQRAETCLIKYWDWEKEHPNLKPIMVEQLLVSEQYGYGGTIDCLAVNGDEIWLIDYKTGKGIYQEMIYQLAAYRQLIRDTGGNIDSARILRIGRETSGDFEERIITEFDLPWRIFKACLEIYNLQKEMK